MFYFVCVCKIKVLFGAYVNVKHEHYIPFVYGIGLSINRYTVNSMIINLKPYSFVLHFYDIVHPLFKSS